MFSPRCPQGYSSIEAATSLTRRGWQEAATAALSQPEEGGASPAQTREDRRRIKQLEREVQRKDKALAETAALLVLSKKIGAIFEGGEDG